MQHGWRSSGSSFARFDKDAESAAGLRAEIRAALRIVGTVPDAGLDTLAAAKSAEVSRSLGTCAARQERLLADREKLLRDKATIEAAGADGTCPLCPAETRHPLRRDRKRVCCTAGGHP